MYNIIYIIYKISKIYKCNIHIYKIRTYDYLNQVEKLYFWIIFLLNVSINKALYLNNYNAFTRLTHTHYYTLQICRKIYFAITTTVRYIYLFVMLYLNTNILTRIRRFKSRQSSKIPVPDSTSNYICRLRFSHSHISRLSISGKQLLRSVPTCNR